MTTITIKRSSTASAIPLAGDLAVGELAVNLEDKRLFTKQSDGTVIELSTNPTDLDAATLRIDGVEITASATELNKLDGFTGSTTELNTLDGLTASTAEINTLDGITATTAELNKLDGYTGSTAELNILDGVTATTAELNFVDGVTSNVQTQLDAKASSTTSPTITLSGDLSGSATLTNLGSATLTATVADDSHNHVISNVDGLQTALDAKANLSGANFTGNVDVTGTVTADGLVVESGGVNQVATFSSSDAGAFIYINDDNALGYYHGASGGSYVIRDTDNKNKINITGNGDVSFYEDTGTTAKMVWDASEETLKIGDYLWLNHDGTNADIQSYNVTPLRINKLGNNVLFCEDGGNVGIGTTNPAYPLDVNGETALQDSLLFTANTSGTPSAGGFVYRPASNTLAFGTAGSERARIDSSGNLLVGKTSSNSNTVGGEVLGSGLGMFTRDGNVPLLLNRQTSDGDIAVFRKNGSTVGSIGTTVGALDIKNAVAGGVAVTYENSTNGLLVPIDTTGAFADGLHNLGRSNARFKDLYLSGGVIASRLQLTSQHSAVVSVTTDFYSSFQTLIPTGTLPNGTYLITLESAIGAPIYYCNTAFIMQVTITNSSGTTGTPIKMLTSNHTNVGAHWEVQPTVGSGSVGSGLSGKIIYGSSATGTVTVKAKRLS